MSGFNRHFDRKPLSLPLTPLVDVVFLLIVFLMLVGTRFETGADAARLPELELTAQPDFQPPEQYVIDAYAGADPFDTAQATLRYQSLEASFDNAAEIAAAVAADRSRTPGVPVLLRADADLPMATARTLLNTLRESGIEAIRVAATRPRTEANATTAGGQP
ncbi:ExbD/TolR family protein [Mucisphaera sp.]|uniref:ExbD/TolR family protein n=1 Tax=Mucisphaera sp. TaxID=2913024 RepID=UPI003D0E83B6